MLELLRNASGMHFTSIPWTTVLVDMMSEQRGLLILINSKSCCTPKVRWPSINFDKNSPEYMACIRIPLPVIPKLMVWSVHLTYAIMHIKNAFLSTPLADLEYKKHF
jgi:hypothetical protein